MSAELVDPFATHGGATASQPDLTAEEWVAIRDEILQDPWSDPMLVPDCLTEAMEALRDIACGVGNPYMPARMATQCLRRLAYRAKTGVPFHEPQEPAWSLDPDPRPFERVLSDDVEPGDLG